MTATTLPGDGAHGSDALTVAIAYGCPECGGKLMDDLGLATYRFDHKRVGPACSLGLAWDSRMVADFDCGALGDTIVRPPTATELALYIAAGGLGTPTSVTVRFRSPALRTLAFS